VRAVGESLDELAAHGERLERLARAAQAVASASEVYARYAAGELSSRAAALLAAERDRAGRARAAAEARRELSRLEEALAGAVAARDDATRAVDEAAGQLAALEAGPLARSQAVLLEKQKRAGELATAAQVGEHRAKEAQSRADTSAARVAQDTARLERDTAALSEQARVASASLAACNVPAPLLPEGAVAARAEVSTAQAAVTVVRAAARDAREAVGRRAAADERSAAAERREEHAQGRLAEAVREASAQEQQLTERLRRWWPDALTDGLTAEALDAMPARARAEAEPGLAAAREAEADGRSRARQAGAELAQLGRRRAEVLAERDPAPPAPALPRPARDTAEGLPLWRLVDVCAGDDGAALEAALEASGLLDAYVRADGAVLGAEDLDTVLPAGPVLDGATLLDVLQPDVPPDSPVTPQVVAVVLRRVALVDRVAHRVAGGPAAIGRDGSWQLGALTGRAAKPAAQYVGTAARAAERTRRLAAVDEAIRRATADRAAAAADQAAAAGERLRLEQWLAGRPSDASVRAAWTRRDEREASLTGDAAEARTLAGQAEAAATAAARAQAALAQLAAQHRLPEASDGLDARAAELAALDRALERLADAAREVTERAVRLEEDSETAAEDTAAAGAARADATEADRAARAAHQEWQALLDTLGVDVRRMQAELDAARSRSLAARAEVARTASQVESLTGHSGEARARSAAAEERLAEARPVLADRARAFVGLTEVSGLVQAALGREVTDQERVGLDAGRGGAVAAPARDWVALVPSRPVDANGVHAELRTLAAGPAADTEPRVVGLQGALAVLARDETGAELPLGQVSARLAATVVRERELLTDRERRLFESTCSASSATGCGPAGRRRPSWSAA